MFIVRILFCLSFSGEQYFAKPGASSTDEVQTTDIDDVMISPKSEQNSNKTLLSNMEKTLSAQEELTGDLSRTMPS